MPAAIKSAREINGVEDKIGAAEIKDGRLLLNINPYQPRTFAITIAKPAAKPTETSGMTQSSRLR